VYICGMPDTRESGDGRSPPPVRALARQLFGLLCGVGLRLRSAMLPIAVSVSVSVVACITPPPENTPPVTFPPPTEEEMARFCARYEEVKDLSWSEMAVALIDYAPDDGLLRAALNAASVHPSPPNLDGVIHEFISRCPVLEDLP
jgi:hypothetical protein